MKVADLLKKLNKNNELEHKNDSRAQLIGVENDAELNVKRFRVHVTFPEQAEGTSPWWVPSMLKGEK